MLKEYLKEKLRNWNIGRCRVELQFDPTTTTDQFDHTMTTDQFDNTMTIDNYEVNPKLQITNHKF